jgi:hypothetical protein
MALEVIHLTEKEAEELRLEAILAGSPADISFYDTVKFSLEDFLAREFPLLEVVIVEENYWSDRLENISH